MINLIWSGRPYTKKTGQNIFINKGSGKAFITQKQAYKDYERDCIWQTPYNAKQLLEGNIQVTALYYMPNFRGWPDLCGLMQATGDILEAAQVIKNDKFIVSWDGTRIAGINKENPCTELTITII